MGGGGIRVRTPQEGARGEGVNRYSIYIVDDDPAIRAGLIMSLEATYQVRAFVSGEDAISETTGNPPDLMLLDVGLSGKDGIQVLSEVRALAPQTLVLMITGHDDVSTAVSAMRLGAHDYIVKPIQMETLEITIRNTLETIRLRKEVQALQEKHLIQNVPFFIGESDVVQDVMDFISMVAKSATTPVMILGETGTGKELIARAIHYRSPNFKGPLITVNCAAIPKDLIESELFGYEKGAFTGASTAGKRGLIQEAESGTLFLDEVGDLGREAQAKLLRFLEGGEFYKVGGTEKLRVQTRVISATNKDIDELVDKGEFRDDLFYRLGVVRMRVPSLNERPEDVLPLAKCFLLEFSAQFGKHFTGISPEAEKALADHRWRGNVRELRNLIERGTLAGKGRELTPKDLGLETGTPSSRSKPEATATRFPPIPPEGTDFLSLQRSFERFYIEEAFRMAEGNESKAARLLKINHHTFRYHRKKLRED
jgi:DNA-binding NtrC family response regulator